MENPFAEEPKPTSAWLWQVFTGVGLVILLGLHFIANHFVAKGGLRDFTEVVAYLRNPIILCLEVLFFCVSPPMRCLASVRFSWTLDSQRLRKAVSTES